MNWSDLNARVLSATVMVLVSIVALWLGGVWFQSLVALAGALMVWEVVQMTGQKNPRFTVVVPVLAAIALMGHEYAMTLVLGVILVLAFVLNARNKILFLTSVVVILLACQLILLAYAGSILLLVWLVLVVIASDVAGYFVGRTMGGPKFWPAVSPKKTWSGTVGGWAAAALIGLGFAVFAGASWFIIPVSVIVAVAAQFGDIAESALKRKMDVKDSSDLIPGHGGFCDRFDALIGGALALWVLGLFGMTQALL